jgi:predicted regulator of Ras-like GTPase activity (Roadblock/LC7/MglB family)
MSTTSRSSQLDSALTDLLRQAPEVEAAAVVSFDGLPMASALPASMDEDRVAAMSAALLSLGERAAQGLGRGDLSQVYIEGENGTVFLVSADDEAVLVAVAARGAKVGMMLFEVRQAAAVVAAALRTEPEAEAPVAEAAQAPVHEYVEPVAEQPYSVPAAAEPAYAETALVSEAVEAVSEPAAYQGNGGGVADLSGWQSYAPGTALNGDSPSWS